MAQSIGRPQNTSRADTMSERAAVLVEQDIISGHLPPGARLGITDLVARYEIGATPLREGLSRLISSGLIISIGQRGFRVADVSHEDLLDITQMRTVVEMEALRLSIEHGDDAWEAGILGVLHQMKRHVERGADDFHEGSGDFERLHKQFHTAILAACSSRRLLQAHSDLYDQAYRYRQVMMRKIGDAANLITVHELLAQCVLSRDIAAAQTMLAAHLRATLHFVYPSNARD